MSTAREIRPDGPRPTIVRGVTVVASSDGELHPTDRPAVALCTCERSASFPWCDSTHKALADRPRKRRTKD